MKVNLETLMLNTDQLLTRLERGGYYTIESQMQNLGYLIKDNNIIVLASKAGTLAINMDNIDYFVEELLQIKEMAKFRQSADIKGA